MQEAAPALNECLSVLQNYNRYAVEVGFMMERTRANPFGELSGDQKSVDPFFKHFLSTQAWAVYRDETLMKARVPSHLLSPRSRKERESFDRRRQNAQRQAEPPAAEPEAAE